MTDEKFEILPAYLAFLHQKSVIVQYKHHIRNQREKLSRKKYISILFKSCQFFSNFHLKTRKIFAKNVDQPNCFRQISFNRVFHTDFEYDVYIA
jgi:hypothetical protein